MKKKVRVAVLPGSEFLAFEGSLKENRVAGKDAEIGIDRDLIGVGRERRHPVRFVLQGGGLAYPRFGLEDEHFNILKRRKLHRTLRSSRIFRWVAQKARIRQIDYAVPRCPEATPRVGQIRPCIQRRELRFSRKAVPIGPSPA